MKTRRFEPTGQAARQLKRQSVRQRARVTRLSFAYALVVILAFPALGEGGGSIPLDVVSVVTCRTHDVEVRISVRNRGFEHIMSKVLLEWLDYAETGPHLLASKEVEEIGMLSVGTPECIRVESGVHVALSGASPHLIGYEANFRLDVSRPGVYTVVSKSIKQPAP